MQQLDRIDNKLTKFMQDVRSDYPTRPMVESYCRNLDTKMSNDFTPLEMFKK